MSDADAILYRRLRAETISLLGFDAATLTTSQSVKTDLVASLRLALDALTAAQLRGEQVDLAKLLSAAETLERLLPSSLVAEQSVTDDHTVRDKVAALLDGYRVAAGSVRDERVAALEAEIAALQARLSEKDVAAARTEITGKEIAVARAAPPSAPPAKAESDTASPPRSGWERPGSNPASAHAAWVRETYAGGDKVIAGGLPADWDSDREAKR